MYWIDSATKQPDSCKPGGIAALVTKVKPESLTLTHTFQAIKPLSVFSVAANLQSVNLKISPCAILYLAKFFL